MKYLRHMRIKIFLLDFLDLVTFLVFITGIVLFVRFFIINPYTVVWASMEPNFHEHDFIVVDKITPRMGMMNRGDVIVFVPQGKHLPFIKRIVWLPWETIRIIEWKVYICDDQDICNELDEQYLPSDFSTSTHACGKDVFPLDDKWYFVLGDNRDHSTDSRCCFGLACYEDTNYEVYPDDIIGKVLMRLYPDMTSFRDHEDTKVQEVILNTGNNISGDDINDVLLQWLENW